MAKASVTNERRQVPARIEVDLLDRVREEARAERRTFTVELAVLLEEALAARAKRGEPNRARSKR